MKREMVKTIIPVMMLPLLLAATVSRAQAPEIEMVFVKGGTFMMGCTADQGKDCNSSERPVHQVTLSDYYIGKYEVTQAQWEAVMGENPSHFTALIWEDMEAFLRRLNERNRTSYAIPSKSQWEKAALPVESVSWKAAQEFIRRLNILTGKKYRLPTEAEWEYAARGGTETPYFFTGNPKDFSDEGFWRKFFAAKTDSISSFVIYAKNSGNRTQEPEIVKPNPFGLKNMLGNVMEYCADKYDPEAYSKSGDKAVNPKVTEGDEWVVRGGNYTSDAADVRVAARGYSHHDAWLKTDPQQPKSIWWYSDIRGIGFRIVCEPDASIINR